MVSLRFKDGFPLHLAAFEGTHNITWRPLFSDNRYDLYTLGTKYEVPEDVVSSSFPKGQERGVKNKRNSWNQGYGIN